MRRILQKALISLLMLSLIWPAGLQYASAADNLTAMPGASRQLVRAVTMADGKVMVIGGNDGITHLSSTVIYDPAMNSWSTGAFLLEATFSHAATLMKDGRILVAGGNNFSTGVSKSVEIYDPATHAWSSAPSLSTARASATASTLPDGRILVAGGGNDNGDLNTTEIYDPETNTWTPGPSMPTTRKEHSAALLGDGRVLLVGGTVNGMMSASVIVYDPTLNEWSAVANLPSPRYVHAATSLLDGRVVINGGFDPNYMPLTSTAIYDPETNAWTVGVNMNIGRLGHDSVLLPDGKVFVVGGAGNSGPMASSESHQQTPRTPMPAASVDSGEIPSGTNVELSSILADAVIHYTTDGTTPTTASPVYSGPITVSETITIKAIAHRNDWGSSRVMSVNYTVSVPPAVNSVSVSPEMASVVQGGTKQLTATVDVVGGAATTVGWTSSDTSDKVTVDEDGLVTVAVDAAIGDYTITATSTIDSSKTDTATITVTWAPSVNSVSVSPETASVVKGGMQQLTVTVDAVGGAATTVTWMSSDTSDKVTVDTSGKVSVAEDTTPGDYTITATSTYDGGKQDTAIITVTESPTYTIAAIADQTTASLIQGYESGSQETVTINVYNNGTERLTNLAATVTETDFAITQPTITLDSGATTSFSVKAKDGLVAGTYTATITISADHMTDVAFAVEQIVKLPNAPVNPQGLTATAGNHFVDLSWNTVTGATYYNVYMSTISSQYNDLNFVTVTEAAYQVLDLTNGMTYHFVVKAGNDGGLSGNSNQASATPATVPAAPTNVAAIAGNGGAVITFMAPTDDGGSAITGYEVFDSQEELVATGEAGSSSITVSGLTNGTAYMFTVKAKNVVGSSDPSAPSNSVTPRAPSKNDKDNHGPSTQPAPSDPVNTSVDVLVNGKAENAGTATEEEVNGKKVTTIAVDEEKLQQRLKAEGDGAIITIPVASGDIVVVELNGRMVKNMTSQQAVVEIRTEGATYTLPAKQINIDAISKQIGQSVELQEIKVKIEIAVPPTETVRVVEDAAHREGLTLVIPPLDFKVSAMYGDTTIDVAKFNSYVERTIASPEWVDPNRITTGVVVEPDGTVRHVPTKVIQIDGIYYAQINSLTNSTYSVVWHPLEFKDVVNHWAKDAVNNMGSRIVVKGTSDSTFSPDRDITRAEFTAIIVRGLGLKPDSGKSAFTDVKVADWYSSAVQTAYEYGLINGFEDGTFRSNEKITREQAMLIIANAMNITGLNEQFQGQSVDAVLQPYRDAEEISSWAVSGMMKSVQAGIVTGRSGNELAPRDFITRAEVATLVEQLLKKSGLI